METVAATEDAAAELSSLGQAALRYAERGVPVFPLHSIDDGGVCTCGGLQKNPKCTPGKHPRWQRKTLERGFKDATTDPEQLQDWWHAWPEANIGVPAGRRTGFWALDVDPRNNGEATYERLRDEYGLPETTQQQTGGGGRQYLYSWAEHPEPGVEVRNATAEIGGAETPGVDVRGEGGYIVVPPSVTADRYRWLDTSIRRVEAPDALVEACGKTKPETKSRKSSPKRAQSRDKASGAAQPSKPQRRSEGRVDVSLDGPVILEGTRNHELTRVAGVLHDGRSLEELRVSLDRVNHSRCSPPLPTAEVGSIAISISRRPPSGTRAEPPKPEALEYLDAISAAWALQAGAWTGLAGDSANSVMQAALEMARRYGHTIPAGVRVSCSVRSLTRAAGLGSVNTARRAALTLAKAGWWNWDRSEYRGAGTTGAFVLKLPSSESGSRMARKPDTLNPSNNSLLVTPFNSVSGMREGDVAPNPRSPSVSQVRTEGEVPADLRHSTADYARLGKRRGRIISLLVESGDELAVLELSKMLGVRASDLRRRSLPMLEDRGIVTVEGDVVRLVGNWREKLEDVRLEGDEYGAAERQAEKHRREHEGFVEARKSKVTESASDSDLTSAEHEPLEAPVPDSSGEYDFSEVA